MDRSHKAQAEGWITLPAEGRDGPEPAFPLANPIPREMEIWERLWEMPQAIMWEQLQLELEVAGYVRCLVRAEAPRSSFNYWTQVRQAAESLGLSVSGLARNRWTVGTVESDDDAGAVEQDDDDFDDRLRLVVGE